MAIWSGIDITRNTKSVIAAIHPAPETTPKCKNKDLPKAFATATRELFYENKDTDRASRGETVDSIRGYEKRQSEPYHLFRRDRCGAHGNRRFVRVRGWLAESQQLGRSL